MVVPATTAPPTFHPLRSLPAKTLGRNASRSRRSSAGAAVVLLALSCLVAVPRSAEAQESFAYVAIPKLKSWTFALRPGDRLTLGELVDFVPKNPGFTTVVVAVAVADGGVRLNDAPNVTRATLPELLSTVVTATADGTVTLVVDANVSVGGPLISSRTVVTLMVKAIASRYRLTTNVSPVRVSAETSYRLRDFVTFEKLDPLGLIQNYGFEVTGGIGCLDPLAKPMACPPAPTGIRFGGVFTEQLLDARFAATGSGRLTVVLFSTSPAGGNVLERFPVDIEISASAPRPVTSAATLPNDTTTTTLLVATTTPTTATTPTTRTTATTPTPRTTVVAPAPTTKVVKKTKKKPGKR